MFRKEEKSVSVVKVVLITLGVVACVAAAAVVVYKFLKKHFKITFECGDCDFCDDDCFCDDSDFEPECICGDCDDCDDCDDIFAELEEEEKSE